MNRREFLAAGGQTLTLTLALAASDVKTERLPAQEQPETSNGLEQRVAAVIQAYDAQGNHRTGTEVDRASAEWLANQVRQSGAEPSLEAFTISRVDPQSCYLRIADRRIDGVPLFDAGFTDAKGVRGRLGPIGSDGEIGLAETSPFKLTDPGIEHAGQLAEARRSRHKAVLLLTRGTRPGLFLINAPAFTKPLGPPMLQVSSEESEWLNEQAPEACGDHGCRPCKTNGSASLQHHCQDRREQSAAGSDCSYGATERLVAMHERTGEPVGLLVGSDARAGRRQTGTRLPLRRFERSRTRVSRNGCISQKPDSPDQTRTRVDFFRLQHWRTATA